MIKDLRDLNKDIKALSKRIDKMIAATKTKPVKQAVKEKTMTAPEVVLGIIKRSRKGVTVDTLKDKAGFEGQKLYNVLYEVKKRGGVSNPRKGFYVKT